MELLSQFLNLWQALESGIFRKSLNLLSFLCSNHSLSISIVFHLFIYFSGKYLTIIGRGWAKYRDLSVASRSIICLSLRLRQIIDLRDTDKSRYFAITEFNNCFINRSPSLFSYFNHFLTAQGSDLPFFSRERGSNYAWAEYYLQQNTLRRYYAWADHYL